MRRPRPWAAARIARSHVQVVPDPVEPDPPLGVLSEPPRQDPDVRPTVTAFRPSAPVPSEPCGCGRPRVGHGRRYGWQLGFHTWMSPAGPSVHERRQAEARADA